MEIKKIKLISTNKIKHFNRDEEDRQEITLDDDGTFNFKAFKPKNEQPTRNVDARVDGKATYEIIMRLADYFMNQPSWSISPGLGTWKLIIIDSESNEHQFFGSQTGYHHDLSVYIQERLPVKDLCLFGY